MRYGVIDIGSNSVRLMISQDGQTLYKLVNTTRLAEGMGSEKLLTISSVDRTVSAVSFFIERAKLEKVDKLYIFATAAVRTAKNSGEFLKAVKIATGFDVDVISGQIEAYIGRIGAIGDNDGGIIDVGGASTEITAVKDGQLIYSKSVEIGSVKIKDFCGQDKAVADGCITNKILEYGTVPSSNYYGIGGTATSLASILLQLEPYDPNLVNGYVLNAIELSKMVDKLYSMSVEQRKTLTGLQPARAEVIAGGALLLLKIMQKIGIESLIVSERDNLEGYLELKRREYEKKN